MEWQVGQWVKFAGRVDRIVSIGDEVIEVHHIEGNYVVRHGDLKPFVWQVGKTYKTTLEGVTATIIEVEPNTVLGRRSDDTGRWRWNKLTGGMCGCEKLDVVPHLLPCLADEPSEAESTLTERFAVEQREGRWAVVDVQEDRWTPCADHETAVRVLGVVKAGQVISGWVRSDYPGDPIEPQQPDPINPQHYRDHPSGVECIQVAEHMPYCLGNAIKYLWRAGKKGDAVQDLKKAAWYINREIERLAKGGA